MRTWHLITKEGRNRMRDESSAAGDCSARPSMMKPTISFFKKLTSHDNNRPPGMIEKSSQEPIPNSVTGRHLINMESVERGGSETEET
jgi:hypothetical protein